MAGGMQIQFLNKVAYEPTYDAMKTFTVSRSAQIQGAYPLTASNDGGNQLWICEHLPVYTQGLAGKAGHVLNPGNIPVVQTDRGGQVTYHGPGQVVAYPLMDLRAAGYYVKEYVYRVEEAVIRTLAHFGVTGHRVRGAPGIYVRLDEPFSHAVRDKSDTSFVGMGKIAALGIKVSRHCTYHGVALNVAMDLEPFGRINPCGYVGLQTTDLSTIGVAVSWQDVAEVFSQKLVAYLAP